MKKKVLLTMLVLSMSASMLAGCGAESAGEVSSQTEATSKSEDATQSADAAADDLAAADETAALIDAIYVQTWTEETEAQCAAAKEAWDKLTDEQKKLVQGENADWDYFGADTGDASLDDPRNADEIGENELLVISFGSSFNETRVKDVKAIEDHLQEAFPGWSVRRAFTSQIIINHILARDGEAIDNVEQALDRAVKNGVKHLVVQPTHLMHGAEYDDMMKAVESYADQFESVAVAEPLLGDVGSDASVVNDDKKAVAEAVVEAAVKDAGFTDQKTLEEDGTAIVLFGHGTSHTAKVSYSQMITQMAELGYNNVFVGTVEGEPEETEVDAVIEEVKKSGYRKVILRPLMVVSGDHANNDMAGDEKDSWKSLFLASGAFDSVECQIAGLGRIPAVQELYTAHTQAVIDEGSASYEVSAVSNCALEDGEYLADFNTDSGMFHVNEACDGKGKLTVKDGVMTIHVTLVSQNIVNLYPGTAEEAEKDGAVWLEPSVDSVTFSDGTTEDVYGFDVPVPSLDEEFDLAIIGKKAKWYDHKVSVTNVTEYSEAK